MSIFKHPTEYRFKWYNSSVWSPWYPVDGRRFFSDQSGRMRHEFR